MINNKIYENLLNRTYIIINQSLGENNSLALKGLELFVDILNSIDSNYYDVIIDKGEFHIIRKGGCFR